MAEDWSGNKRSTFATLGASNHSDYEREERDFYATSPQGLDPLFDFLGEELPNKIWEPACGNGHLSKRIKYLKPDTELYSSDIIKREFECDELDFLEYNKPNSFDGDIITNPPYNKALEFVEKSLETIKDGYRVSMFLKLTFLEGQKRRVFFESYTPPATSVYFLKEYK